MHKNSQTPIYLIFCIGRRFRCCGRRRRKRLFDVLSPSLLARVSWSATILGSRGVIRMRQRLLTLPVLVAIIVVWCGGGSPPWPRCNACWRAKGCCGSPRSRSAPKPSRKLDVVPAVVMGQLCAGSGPASRPSAAPLAPAARAPVRERFPLLAIVDGSTLKRCAKAKALQSAGLGTAGKGWSWWRRSAIGPCGSTIPKRPGQHKRGAGEILAALPPADCWSLI